MFFQNGVFSDFFVNEKSVFTYKFLSFSEFISIRIAKRSYL